MRSLGTLYAAAVTPLDENDKLDLDGVGPLLAHLAAAGCDGAVIAGTTGEGPALTVRERTALIQEALATRPPTLRLIAGTGCSALPNTIALTRHAYELGVDAALVVPPFYFKNVTPAGLLACYRRIVSEAVPPGERVLLYHIPQITGIPIPNEVIDGLLSAFPDHLLGVKDSQGDRAHTLDWCRRYRSVSVFVGNDPLLSAALDTGAAGAIFASANVFAPAARALLDAHSRGEDTAVHQAQLDAIRTLLNNYNAPAALKALLAARHALPGGGRTWSVRLPLVPLAPSARAELLVEVERLAGAAAQTPAAP
jgi:4-hydroxy-tetrahydrodipicolinate synthase